MKNRRCLKNLVLILLFVSSSSALLHAAGNPEVARWEREAGNVTIIRDDWGIAHVYGKTDADAVFGMEYAQAEDDFNRVETNYINAMGRLAETEGESKIYLDLRMKLFIDPVALKTQYAASPAWLKTLMDSFADGLNFYLYKHPEVKPRVIKHFEPWMALSFTEGSIGGDIERVNLNQLEAFYSKPPVIQASNDPTPPRRNRLRPRQRPTGANRLQRHGHRALQHRRPPRSAAHQPPHLLLLPLRAADVQRSGAGRLRRRHLGPVLHLPGLQRTRRLDAHLERRRCSRRVPRNRREEGRRLLSTSTETRSARSSPKQITVPYKTDHGMAEKKFTVYFSHHGPIIRERERQMGQHPPDA